MTGDLDLMTKPLPPSGEAVAPARILIADNNPISVDLLRAHLEAQGHTVDWAEDGAHALAMAATGVYAVMFLDIHMPVYNGAEVMRRLHLVMGRRIYVIAITADRLAARREEMLRMGVDAYLTKPVDLALLNEELRRGLDRYRR